MLTYAGYDAPFAGGASEQHKTKSSLDFATQAGILAEVGTCVQIRTLDEEFEFFNKEKDII